MREISIFVLENRKKPGILLKYTYFRNRPIYSMITKYKIYNYIYNTWVGSKTF